jgi:two-component system sensor histidine kinase SenX3
MTRVAPSYREGPGQRGDRGRPAIRVRPATPGALGSRRDLPGATGTPGPGPVSPTDEQRRLQQVLDILLAQTGEPQEGAGSDDLVAQVAAAAERAASRLRDAESLAARLRGALNWVGDGVVVCDDRGVEVYRNSRAVALGAGRLAPASLGDAFRGDGRLGDVLAVQAVADALEAARRGERPERRLELFSPTRRNLVVRAWPVRGEGGNLGAVAIIEDISERRRLEAVRRDFVANVSHELKTPVGALSLLAETLEEEDDPEVVARLAGRVSTEAARLGRIIDELLDLSRIEVDDTPLREPTPVGMVLHQAVDPLVAMAESREITIDLSEAAPELVVMAHRRDLVSAVGNLVENAIKYSEARSLVRVVAGGDDRWVTITVSDQGMGIPRHDLERIFERFYRVDRARSRSTGGTGLGLSIVRHVAANHGGSVEVESEEGVGSTFRLRLPAQGLPVEGLPVQQRQAVEEGDG